VLGKVNLPPALGPAQFPDAFARRNANVPCHAFIMDLVFALDLVHTLSLESWDEHSGHSLRPLASGSNKVASQEDLQRTMRGKTDEELYRLLNLDSQDYTP
jgi:hypothetical protein